MFVPSLFRCVVLALALGGCAYHDHFDDRVGRYDLAAAASRDAMMLTNVLRASKAEPLSFVQLGQISGSSTSQAAVGLPSLILGPHIQAATSVASHVLQSESVFGANPIGGNGSVGNAASIMGSTNFQVTPQETKDFYKGLLREVAPHELELFIHQGIARELLFYLFTERLIIERDGKKSELVNDPLDPSFSKFQDYVALAMDHGLTSEPAPGRAGASAEEEKSETNADKKTAAGEKPTPLRQWRLCFDKLREAENVVPANNAPRCGDKASGADPRVVSFISHDGTTVRLRVVTRSTLAIFNFLGRIVAAGDAGRIKLHGAEAIGRGPLADEYLFVVEQGPSAPCFLSAFFEGQFYCVPQEGAANTKRIFGLLAQLIALNTSVADVSVSPTVRLLQ